MHARVTLVKHPRHLRRSDEARVVFTLSGKIINVTRAGETLEDALYAVFDVLERELHDFRSLRRGVSKDPGPRVRGRTGCLDDLPLHGWASVIGTPKTVILEQLEIFAQEVMPTFNNQVKAPTLANA